MLAYIAGPYSAPTREEVQKNIDIAEAVGKQALRLGYTPIIPHRITGMWDTDPMFGDMKHKDWMEKVCFPLLDACEVLILAPNWRNSVGTLMELERALINKMQIRTI